MNKHRVVSGFLLALVTLGIGAGAAALITVVIPKATLSTTATKNATTTTSTAIHIENWATTTTEIPIPIQDEGPTEASEPKAPTISARNYRLTNLTQELVVIEKRDDTRWPLASITKLVTASVALDKIPAGTPITIVDVPGGNPSRAGIPVGEVFAFEDVLKVMLVSSSNEAAESLAAYIGRDIFLAAMNTKVNTWGLTKTVFEDPTGLSPVNQSTATEVTTIAQKLLSAQPQIFTLTRNQQATIYAINTEIPYTAYTTHALAGDVGFVGGKTGYTDEARGNLLTLLRIGGSTYAIVILGSEQRFTDTRLIRTQQL